MLIICDDYGYSDVGWKNAAVGDVMHTPVMNDLSARGIRLGNYYVQPICTPTRSVLMTGRYQIRTGLQHGVIHPKMPSGVPTNFPLISNLLQGYNYSCHIVGKWHLGFYSQAHTPWRRGFNSSFGYLGGMEDPWTHQVQSYYDWRDNGIPDHTVATGGKHPDPSRYGTKLIRERAVAIIEDHAANHSGSPLFLYLPFQAVHAPLEAPPYWVGKQESLVRFNGDKNRRIYAAMVEQMDFAIGKVVDALQAGGLYNDTLIVLSADNGGIKPGGYNWPLRGQKATLWEGGMRATGFVHSPRLPHVLAQTRKEEGGTTSGGGGDEGGGGGGGYEYSGLVHVSDWLPTFLKLAGGDPASVRPAGLDGYDVFAAITAGDGNNSSNSPRTELLHNIDIYGGLGVHGFGDAALRLGDLKLIVRAKPGDPRSKQGHFVPPECGSNCTPPTMPSDRGCVADSPETVLWLFDLATDPLETCNLANARPADVKRLMDRLGEYNSSQVAINYPPNDPKADPSTRKGIEKGSWGPWQ